LTTGREIGSRLVWDAHRVAVNPSGTMIAVASKPPTGKPGTVTLWRVTTDWPPRLALEPDHILRARNEVVEGMAFSPDGRQLATVSRAGGGDLELWEVSTGRPRRAIEVDSRKWIFAVAFHPDGQQLAVACGDGTVKVYDAATGGLAGILRGHTGEVYD